MAAVVAQPMTAGQEQLPLAPGSATERAASCPVETAAAAAPAERQLSCPVEFSAEPVPAKAEEDTKDVDDGKEATKEDDTAKDPADVGESSMITGLVEKPGSAQLRDAAPPREDANGDEAIKHIDDGKEAADKGDLDQGANGKNVNDVGESAEITGLVEKPCSAQLRDAAPPRPITGGTKNVTPISAAKSLLASKGISVDLEEDISEHLEHPVEECIDSKVAEEVHEEELPHDDNDAGEQSETSAEPEQPPATTEDPASNETVGAAAEHGCAAAADGGNKEEES